jgi:hypothetical protein
MYNLLLKIVKPIVASLCAPSKRVRRSQPDNDQQVCGDFLPPNTLGSDSCLSKGPHREGWVTLRAAIRRVPELCLCLGLCNYVELIDTIFTDVEGVD